MIIQIGTEVDESRILWKHKESDEWERADIDDLIQAYENGQKEGEWVEVVKRTEQYDKEGRKSWAVIYQCPNCGFVLNAIENHITQYNYCPNCGVRMEIEE